MSVGGVTSANSAAPSQHPGVRHDFGSDAMRVASVVGIGGGLLNLARWGAAGPYNKARGTLGLWAYSMVPIIGPGVNNKIVPIDHGLWKTSYRASNMFNTVMTGASAAIAIPNLITGISQGWHEKDGQGPIAQALGGAAGIATTRAGRTGLVSMVMPAITGGIILGAGWHARSEGLMAILKAGQDSPLRGSFKLGMLGVAMMPLIMLNESGALDSLNSKREATDTRSAGTTFVDGVTSLPETMRSLKLPFVPKGWVPQSSSVTD